ncbi:MAG: alpha/beta fold hydrolase [Pseudomonadota bacterium]
MLEIETEAIWELLGMRGGAPKLKGFRIRDKQAESGFVQEEIEIETRTGVVPATLMRPLESGRRYPAILYCHAHGKRYDIGRAELATGRPALHAPFGPDLVARGFAVLCADMPGFGSRQHEGGENALAKAALWNGTTLMGAMLADLSACLDYLTSRQDVDPARISTLGISMGATHAYWLAALDQRISGVAHLCAFANMQPLIESGAHDLHGPYMTVPGLLQRCDMADIAAMIAPRPQFVAYGCLDPLTPAAAIEPALATLHGAYQRAGAPDELTVQRSINTGHVETPEMREAVLRFLTL